MARQNCQVKPVPITGLSVLGKTSGKDPEVQFPQTLGIPNKDGNSFTHSKGPKQPLGGLGEVGKTKRKFITLRREKI